jgi:hypothetical protein
MKTKKRNYKKRTGKRNNKKKIKQFGGVRFIDIITMENKDQHIGKEVELVSIFDSYMDVDKLFKLNRDEIWQSNWGPSVMKRYYNHRITHDRDVSGESNLSELVGYSGKLLSDHWFRDNIVVVDYIHLNRALLDLNPHIVDDSGQREILIPDNLCSLTNRSGGAGDNIFYLLQLKRNEPHFDALARLRSPCRLPTSGDRTTDRTDFFTSENFAKLGKSAIKRNVFNPTMETDRFIRRIVDESNKSKRRNRCMGKYSRKPEHELFVPSLDIPISSKPSPAPGTRRFTVKKQNKFRDANLSMTPPQSWSGFQPKEIALNQDILQLLRSYM